MHAESIKYVCKLCQFMSYGSKKAIYCLCKLYVNEVEFKLKAENEVISRGSISA